MLKLITSRYSVVYELSFVEAFVNEEIGYVRGEAAKTAIKRSAGKVCTKETISFLFCCCFGHKHAVRCLSSGCKHLSKS